MYTSIINFGNSSHGSVVLNVFYSVSCQLNMEVCMYRLCIYDSADNLVCLIHGSLDDICFIIDNVKFAITYRFKITEV